MKVNEKLREIDEFLILVGKIFIQSLGLSRLGVEMKLLSLTRQWNELVAHINKKGSEKVLSEERVENPIEFEKSDVIKLILLCHPDKHGGSSLSNEMTRKLLKFKGNAEQAGKDREDNS